jgi:hypothetical protein
MPDTGHAYKVAMVDQTVVADETLVIIHTAAAITTRGSIIEILRAGVGQRGTATSQQLGILLAQKATAFGTYTATTPAPTVVGGAASGIAGGTAGAAATAGTDASAEGAGTVTNILEDGFNVLNGWLWVPTPEERLLIPSDTALILKLVGTPLTLTGWNAYVIYREVN